MRNKILRRELSIVAVIFTFICASLQMGLDKQSNKELQKELLFAKKVAVELYDDRENYIAMVDSLNGYADKLEGKIAEASEIHKMREDLAKVPRGLKKITIATCFDETEMKYNAVHKGKGNKGVKGICGIHKSWIGKIPGLTKDNINTLYAGSLVLQHYIDNSNNEFEALKGYKGSKTNLRPVYNTLNFKKVVDLYAL